LQYLNFDEKLNLGAMIILGVILALCSFQLIKDASVFLFLWIKNKKRHFRIAKYHILVIVMSLVRFT
jgi:hypothetical protein